MHYPKKKPPKMITSRSSEVKEIKKVRKRASKSAAKATAKLRKSRLAVIRNNRPWKE